MRTTDLHRAASNSTLRFLALLGVAGSAVLACQSVHLTPDAGTTTTSTGIGGSTSTSTTGGSGGTMTVTATTGGGGNPPGGCTSNAGCTFPTAVCDLAQGKCFECSTFSDCEFRPGTVCSEGSCICPNLGANGKPDPDFAFCPALGPQTNRCVNIQTSKDDCGECGHPCFGACNAGKCADPWEPTSQLGAPEARRDHVAVWDSTDHVMVVWGGSDGGKALDTGGIYDPKTRVWTKTSMVDAPSPRFNATAVWDDNNKHMIVWGGQNGGTALGDGALFDPKMNTWKLLPLDLAPFPRWGHTAVWTGAKMIVWGGFNGTDYLATGAIYQANMGTWAPFIGATPPVGRTNHSAVWRPSADPTAANMFIWGGFDGTNYLNDGATYREPGGWDPTTNAFGSTPPSPRARHTAIYTGTYTLIWGGADAAASFSDGDSHKGDINGVWTPLDPMGPITPGPRQHHTAVWVNNQMIIWGGDSAPSAPSTLYNDGFSITDADNALWQALPVVPFAARSRHSAVVDDATKSMIIWGGHTGAGVTNTGGIYVSK